ncbi:hypothetical protein DFJ74DRAFT_404735 [Hyaloraphidium curvatum]|nr:hypothetical protein DFJ74DRAFT_404735 [Hyaloraphidium curvatum]
MRADELWSCSGVAMKSRWRGVRDRLLPSIKIPTPGRCTVRSFAFRGTWPTPLLSTGNSPHVVAHSVASRELSGLRIGRKMDPPPNGEPRPIQGLPDGFSQPKTPREGTIATGRYSPFDVFRSYRPSESESAVARKASAAFNTYWLIGTGLGLAGTVAIVRKTPFNFRTVPGTLALVSVMTIGEYGGRKLGERAGLRILLDELPQDSELRKALIAAQQSGPFTPSMEGSIDPDVSMPTPTPSLDRTAAPSAAFPPNVGPPSGPTPPKPRRTNKYGDPIEDYK